MNTTKKLITLLLAMLAVNTSIAYDFKVNGIYYLVNGSEATVTAPTPYYIHSNDYTGDVVIPETVTYQGVTYPVTAIGEYAFYWCAELTSIHIPKSIKRVEGSMCFYSCPSLSVVEIESLESWCNIDFEVSNGYDFSYSNPLSYAHDLYINGEKLTELVIPSSVTRIGTSAFCHLTSVSRLEIPSSVTSIGKAAFARCDSIDRLDIPDLESWLRIKIQDRGGNPMSFARKVYFDGIEMSHDFVIPETITKIPANAFNGCNIITSVTFPRTIVEVGINAFSGCNRIKEVHIQDIAAWCNIKFQNGSANPLYCEHWWVERKHIYLGNDDITDSVLSLPDSLTSIGDFAFVDAAIDGYIIPNQVVSIGSYAFLNGDFEEMILPDSLQILGDGAFFYCSLLNNIYLGKCLQKIPDNAFYGCSHLAHLEFPETVNEIGDEAFYGSGLTEMPMNDAITRIGFATFGYTRISELNIGKSVRIIDDAAFTNCFELKEAIIPNHVDSIGEQVFRVCDNLESASIGEGVHVVGDNTFDFCSSLRRVSIGSNVEKIGKEAFYWDKNIDSIACKAKTPPVLAADAFDSNCYDNATLYVPLGSVEAYKTADVWKNFKNIVTMSNAPGDVNGDGEINIADANSVIDVVILGGNAGHTRMPADDVNNDGEVNIGDVNFIINIIIGNY